MKTLFTFAIALAITVVTNAQIETPQPSPSAELEQVVGLTEVEVEYSRPNVRNRKIFGDLVPYGKLWRTGANKNTTVTFSDDVVVDGQTLKAGSYAIFTTPNATSWDVYFYTDTNNWGVPKAWDEAKVAAKTSVEVYPLPIDIETFTISIDDLQQDAAVLGMMWERAYVGVKFNVPTDAKVSEQITKVMSGPDADDYYASAVYYLNSGKDINQAKQWMDKAISSLETPGFWQLRQQSLIYAEAGDKDGAIKIAKQSLEAAKKAGNDDYIQLNMKSLAEWGVK